MKVKTLLGFLVFVVLLVVVTYAVFVVWLPSVRSSGIEVEGGGVASNPYTVINPDGIRKEGDWIIIESAEYGSTYDAALCLTYPDTPKYIKMIWRVSGGSYGQRILGGIHVDMFTIPEERSLQVPENATVADLPGIVQPYYGTGIKEWPWLKPGEYVVEIFIGKDGFIEKLVVNGMEIPPAEENSKIIPASFPPKGMWRIQICFDDSCAFTIAVKIEEVEF